MTREYGITSELNRAHDETPSVKEAGEGLVNVQRRLADSLNRLSDVPVTRQEYSTSTSERRQLDELHGEVTKQVDSISNLQQKMNGTLGITEGILRMLDRFGIGKGSLKKASDAMNDTNERYLDESSTNSERLV